MKVGVRKPSIKKSIKARTTGKAKRAIKRSVNPLYGKKGVGFAKDPAKSVKNAVYHRTTVGVRDLMETSGPSSTPTLDMSQESIKNNSLVNRISMIFILIVGFIVAALGVLLLFADPSTAIAPLICAAVIFGAYAFFKKKGY